MYSRVLRDAAQAQAQQSPRTTIESPGLSNTPKGQLKYGETDLSAVLSELDNLSPLPSRTPNRVQQPLTLHSTLSSSKRRLYPKLSSDTHSTGERGGIAPRVPSSSRRLDYNLPSEGVEGTSDLSEDEYDSDDRLMYASTWKRSSIDTDDVLLHALHERNGSGVMRSFRFPSDSDSDDSDYGVGDAGMLRHSAIPMSLAPISRGSVDSDQHHGTTPPSTTASTANPLVVSSVGSHSAEGRASGSPTAAVVDLHHSHSSLGSPLAVSIFHSPTTGSPGSVGSPSLRGRVRPSLNRISGLSDGHIIDDGTTREETTAAVVNGYEVLMRIQEAKKLDSINNAAEARVRLLKDTISNHKQESERQRRLAEEERAKERAREAAEVEALVRSSEQAVQQAVATFQQQESQRLESKQREVEQYKKQEEARIAAEEQERARQAAIERERQEAAAKKQAEAEAAAAAAAAAAKQEAEDRAAGQAAADKQAQEHAAQAAKAQANKGLSDAKKKSKLRLAFLADVQQAVKLVDADPAKKNVARQLWRKINLTINQISNEKQVVVTKINVLKECLKVAQGQDISLYRYALNLAADKLVARGDVSVATDQAAAFPVAFVIVAVAFEHPDLMTLVLAYFHDRSPITIPAVYAPRKGESDKDYLLRIGWRKSADGPNGMETQEAFLTRQVGYISLLAAITQTELPEGSEHPFGIENAWAWLANVLNRKSIRPVMTRVIHPFLEVCGHELSRVYKKQFRKLMVYIDKVFIPNCPAGSSSSIVRLQTLLESYIQHGTIPVPEARNLLG